MSTLLMSLGLVTIVGLCGYTFSRKMDELFSDLPDRPAADTQQG